jgi:hypothetical protein
MILNLEKKYGISSSMYNLMDDDFVVDLQLSLLAFNIIKKVCRVSNGFISFKNIYEKNNPIICYP